MASLGLLLLSAALIHTAQSLPAGRDGGRGLDSAVRRQRRHLRDLLPYGDQMMSYPSFKAGSGANDVYYQPEDWRGRGLDQALQRLVEREQRRENEEEERAAYLSALLRLLSEAESVGLVGPGDVEVVEEVEEEDEENDQGPPGDFQDYDETGQRMSMGRPPAAWWSLVGPQQTQVLLDRMEPQLVKSLLQRAGQTGRVSSGLNRDQDTLRRLVARILSSIGPDDVPVMRLAKRGLSFKTAGPVSSAHRRTRRSLDDMAPPLPSNSPPLLRVKRLEDEEEEEQEVLHTHVGRLQRMKRIDTMATADMEELNRENQKRRRRAAMNYDPQILISQILEYVE
ncbi:proprotein convertase subtilisin/kexin type 1 inhibitor, like [Melanotaenia boesemani]|uniref:proprotein convertase subtilisin/kexin type 1 inhibitor, like n=1 Tax=Melanotaenia boesemani TaxID=1250792 RepID=UPI001C051216|nr:proprotein convertase subtilisin/kexin type 1 inhibitor, like [Melanotaenia boesemani]XP_041858819.1 proprotein convertase subtilisin/kexin type 1 inhibitor, like [Melanotaenia boesemani]